jgi:PII-like signaling protein
MSTPHTVTAQEIGQIRIYMTPGERPKGGSKLRNLLSSKQAYRELVQAAKAAGLMNAVAHPAQYGFSGSGQIQDTMLELPNPALTVCVELIGHRDQLEAFCRQHGDVLAGKVVVYKHLEHWTIGRQGAVTAEDVTEGEVPRLVG